MGPFEFPKTLELEVVNPLISRKDLFVVTYVAMGTRDIQVYDHSMRCPCLNIFS